MGTPQLIPVEAQIDAAEKYAEDYDEDPSPGIKSAVLNAFYAGIKFGSIETQALVSAGIEAVIEVLKPISHNSSLDYRGDADEALDLLNTLVVAREIENQGTWCGYVAGMIATYLRMGTDDQRIKAMASIIERRLWALKPSENSPIVPSGWQLVPVRCTDEMGQAAYEEAGCPTDGWHGFEELWAAALKAAPKPEEEKPIHFYDDWRPIRAALDAAYEKLGRKFTKGGGCSTADWNLAVLIYKAVEEKNAKETCVHCQKSYLRYQTYRCFDCKATLCEYCAPEHFGPKHQGRAEVAHPKL